MENNIDISADLLRDLYNKGEVSQYLCINKTISKSINLTIRLSKACNLLCKFCIQGKAYKKTYDETGHCNEVTYKVIDKLNEELKSLSDKKVIIRLYGGEPFLFDIFGFLSRIEPGNNKVQAIIVTNGTFFNKIRECMTIKKKNLVIRFSISIHEDYVDVDKMLNNICSIDKKFIHNINVVATGKNDEFVDYLIKNYSDNYKINVQPIRDTNTKIVNEEVQKKYASITPEYLLNNEITSRGTIKNILPTLDMVGAVCKADTFAKYDYETKDYLISTCVGEPGLPLEKATLLNENIICKGTKECSGCTVKYAYKMK